MQRVRKDLYDRVGDIAEENVAMKFAEAGVVPFPEVDLGRAAFASGIPEKKLLHALRNRKLRGRRVGDKHLIRIVDLWYFTVSLEADKLLRKDHR